MKGDEGAAKDRKEINRLETRLEQTRLECLVCFFYYFLSFFLLNTCFSKITMTNGHRRHHAHEN